MTRTARLITAAIIVSLLSLGLAVGPASGAPSAQARVTAAPGPSPFHQPFCAEVRDVNQLIPLEFVEESYGFISYDGYDLDWFFSWWVEESGIETAAVPPETTGFSLGSFAFLRRAAPDDGYPDMTVIRLGNWVFATASADPVLDWQLVRVEARITDSTACTVFT
ncbi:MAG: hypothetical protein RIE08_15180 [Acidimicrobiales bacterium]